MQTNKTPKVIKLTSSKNKNSFNTNLNTNKDVMRINSNRLTDEIIDNLASLIKD